METFAVRLLPRKEYVERHLRRADAQRYLEVFNRVMRPDEVRAELVPEPVDNGDLTSATVRGTMTDDECNAKIMTNAE